MMYILAEILCDKCQLWSFTGRRDLQIVCELIGEFRKSAKSTYKFDFSVIS